ncbi:exopolysaccharide biosynthesis protein [Gymnodinialimonas ceratoperidinii]|uniref:Exopolysaccharide biosynthesis protein n=1 Tax=Gymnodinialimonas ceratoperidinii TaxID=2856823 RepID=A0A8F6TWC1_9RHOB|nr:exopolysaccharide biosynthesis protein [Gymnodinialimonas ceratoperidinii]QXT39119.1 exopolysaccharide biosynthesis protein [Gymnodinialimonas ceratoperidinii]
MTVHASNSTEDAAPSASDPEPILSNLADDVAEAAKEEDGQVDKMVQSAGASGLLPIMTLLGLLLVSPLSGIPLFSTSMGLMIALCAAQTAMGRDKLWLPDFLRRRKVKPGRVVSAMDRVHSVAEWLEARATSRLTWLSEPPSRLVFLCVAALYGVLMPLMEFIPFTSSFLGAAVLLTGLGLLLRDGILLLLSILPALIAVGLIFGLVVL